MSHVAGSSYSMAPRGSPQPRPTLDGSHHWYPLVEEASTCRIEFLALETRLKQLHPHHDNFMDVDNDKEQLLICCKDVRDRFEMWCASFNVVDKTLDRSLRKSVGVAGVVFRLFNEILALLGTCARSFHCCGHGFALLTSEIK